MAQNAEDYIQAEAFKWAWNNRPETRKRLFHVPNGGKRNIIEATKLKAMGVLPGVADLLLQWKGRLVAFEGKTETGVLSPAQKELHAIWIQDGVPVFLFRTVEEFQTQLDSIIRPGYRPA